MTPHGASDTTEAMYTRLVPWLIVVPLMIIIACSKQSAPTTSSVVPAPSPAAASTPVPTASQPAAAPSASPDAPGDGRVPAYEDFSRTAVKKMLAGIAQFKQLVQQRLAIGRETLDTCTSKLDARKARVGAIEDANFGGYERLTKRRTRWACCAPNIDQTIDAPVVSCLMSCTEDDTPHNGSEDDDWAGPGSLREDCQHALIALDDWAADLNVGKF